MLRKCCGENALCERHRPPADNPHADIVLPKGQTVVRNPETGEREIWIPDHRDSEGGGQGQQPSVAARHDNPAHTKEQENRAWRMWIAGRARGLEGQGMDPIQASKQAMYEAQVYRADDAAQETPPVVTLAASHRPARVSRSRYDESASPWAGALF